MADAKICSPITNIARGFRSHPTALTIAANDRIESRVVMTIVREETVASRPYSSAIMKETVPEGSALISTSALVQKGERAKT